MMSGDNGTPAQSNQVAQQAIGAGLAAYSSAMTEATLKALPENAILAGITAFKLSLLTSAIDIGQVAVATQSGNPYAAGEKFSEAVGGLVGAFIGAELGAGVLSVPGAAGGQVVGSVAGKWIWDNTVAPAMGLQPNGDVTGGGNAFNVASMTWKNVTDDNGNVTYRELTLKFDDQSQQVFTFGAANGKETGDRPRFPLHSGLSPSGRQRPRGHRRNACAVAAYYCDVDMPETRAHIDVPALDAGSWPSFRERN
jgi:hypothetical protein